MTPVQAGTIPLFLSHKDVLVEAVTGSGKTLAFVIPCVEILLRREERLRRHQVGAMIVTPTRELAAQIESVVTLIAGDSLTHTVMIGGTDVAADMAAFESHGAHIVIGTPGRLLDMLDRCSSMNVRSLEVLVLDEADRLLDLGFEATLNSILGRLPRQRRTGLFSATQTQELRALARAGMRNPVQVRVAVTNRAETQQQSTPKTLENAYVVCSHEDKLGRLVSFLCAHPTAKVMVFAMTCACVDYLAAALRLLPQITDAGITVMDIHGRMKSKRRTLTFANFRDAPAGVLVCTDLAARGLDVADITHVIQYDPPQDPDMFVHRVGRTARIGRQGAAMVLLLPHELPYIEFLEARQVPLVEQRGPGLEANAQDLPTVVQDLALTHRDLYEKGLRAYVSFVRAYKNHRLPYVFPFNKLDLGALAHGYGLVHLPRMPETKGDSVAYPQARLDIDTDAIPFVDRIREKQRLKRLRAFRDSADARRAQQQKRKEARERSKPWSRKKQQLQKRAKRKEKKEKKRMAKRKRDTFTKQSEWDQLEEQARQLVQARAKRKKNLASDTGIDD